MPEQLEDKTIFSLKEVALSIQKTIAQRYGSQYWIKAEMNKLNYYKHSGHCYPELVQKEEGKVVAQMSATLWKLDFIRINNNFKRLLSENLREGIKILVLASISYEPVYGFTLKIQDIDPSYTLGDLEREKQETLLMLKREGIYFQNKQVPFPLLPKRLAIISVETSKGYADFLKVITQENAGYRFFHMLFPSLLQGDKAAKSLGEELEKIRKVQHHFDVVCIVRGGGGDIGLSCFNDPDLARKIATFPLPVLTGIGHATNLTVAEEIAYLNAITPTQLAGMLMEKFDTFAKNISDYQETLLSLANDLPKKGRKDLAQFGHAFSGVVQQILIQNKYATERLSNVVVGQTQNRIALNLQKLEFLPKHLQNSLEMILQKNKTSVQRISFEVQKGTDRTLAELTSWLYQIQQRLKASSPQETLQRGYSITYHQHHSIKNTQNLAIGETLTTQLYKGEIESTITKITKT